MYPDIVFIVPYRDRIPHKFFFDKYMQHVLEDISSNTYEIYYAEQCDDRPFNRGAMKNIGFIAMKEKYIDHYHDITFVFNDVDCVPYTKNILDYNTRHGTIKHFYGFKHLLGGIVSIKGKDFETINGYPNFWTWGYEDNFLNIRALKHNLTIDRSTFFDMNDSNILHFFHGNKRLHDMSITTKTKTNSGLNTIKNLKYTIQNNMICINNFISLNDTLSNKNIKNIKNINIDGLDYMEEKKHMNKRCKNPAFHMNFK